MSTIAENWYRVRDAVAAAAVRAGRQPSEVRIVVASKTKSAAVIEEAMAAGAQDFGENYVQEAATKIPLVHGNPCWHLIGHLQRNKASKAVQIFDVVQSVDSIALAQALARHADQAGKVLPILIEVNLAGESAKSGLSPDGAGALVDAIGTLPALRLDGLMAIPPAVEPTESRRYFRDLKSLCDRLRRVAPENAPLTELSMGMSGDFEAAVEEGATIVRIGSAILGSR